MNEEEKKALKVINARTRRLLDELEIEKEDMSDEPRIAYLMQEIRANKTILNLIEKLQKENEELKKERQIVGMPVRNKRDGRIGIVLHQWESGSVAVLESINPRVINTHDSWNTLEIVTDGVKQDGKDTNVGSI